MTVHDTDRDLVPARSLTLIAGMTGAMFNGQPIIEGPTLIPNADGTEEFVLIRTGTFPSNWQQYLIAADAKIDLQTTAR